MRRGLMRRGVRAGWLVAACLGLAGAALAAAPEPLPVGELPDQASPRLYRVALVADPARASFSGEAEIDLDLKAATDSLWIHGQGLRMEEAMAVAGDGPVKADYAQVHATGLARLTFARKLKPGRVTLKFRYTAPFMQAGEGFYRAKVGDRWYAWTQFQAIDARRVFPGFDEPRHKTMFSVSITAPAGMKAFANGPEVEATPVDGGMVRHRFAPIGPAGQARLAAAKASSSMATRMLPRRFPPRVRRQVPVRSQRTSTPGSTRRSRPCPTGP